MPQSVKTSKYLAIHFNNNKWSDFTITPVDTVIEPYHPWFHPLPSRTGSLEEIAKILREVLKLGNPYFFILDRSVLPEYQYHVNNIDRLYHDNSFSDLEILFFSNWTWSWNDIQIHVDVMNWEGYRLEQTLISETSYNALKKRVRELLDSHFNEAKLVNAHINTDFRLRTSARSLGSMYLYLSRQFAYGPNGSHLTFSYDQFFNKVQTSPILQQTIGFKLIDRSFLTYVTPITKEERSGLYKVFSHGQSVPELLPFKLSGKDEVEPLLFGVELECKTDYQVEDIINIFPDLFLAAKADSTITGTKTYAYELVTVPASLLIHKKMWAIMFDKLDIDRKFDTSTNTGNGFHVHIGQDSFHYTAYGSNNDDQFLVDGSFNSPHLRHVNAFTWFFVNPDNYNFMLELSGRTPHSLNQWAPMPFEGRVTTPAVAKAKKNTQLHSTSYIKPLRGSVHITRKGTVEVRLFKGIVNYNRIISNLEFIDAVHSFTSTASYLNNTLVNFLKWLETTPENKYMFIKRHIRSMDSVPKIKDERGKDRKFKVSEKTLKLQREWFNNFLKNDHTELVKKGF